MFVCLFLGWSRQSRRCGSKCVAVVQVLVDDRWVALIGRNAGG
jgi:hypothetical protein